MGVHQDSASINDPEAALAQIAQTAQWEEIPAEIEQYREMLEKVYSDVHAVQVVLSQTNVLKCKAGEEANKAADAILNAISEQQTNLNTKVAFLKQDIEKADEAISEANKVELPGSFLDGISSETIRNATKPMDWVVPGLGTVTGIFGGAAVDFINNQLSEQRKQKAAEEYARIQNIMPRGFFEIIDPIPVVVDAPKSESESYDGSHSISAGNTYSFSSLGARVGSAAAAGIAAVGSAAALSAAARANSAHATTGTNGASVAAAKGSISSSAGNQPPAGFASWEEYYKKFPIPSGSGSSSTATLNGQSSWNGSLQAGGVNASGIGRDDLVWDPATGQWVRRSDLHQASVDSSASGLHGAMNFGAVGAGAAVGAGGAALASRLSNSSSSAATALSGSAGVGGASTAGLSSLGSSGIGGTGSFYANNPVSATPVTSSVKGMRGLAAGLSQSSGSAAATAGSGASRGMAPGMMGNQGNSSQKKNKRRGMAYVMPEIEDAQEFQLKPRAAMAGRRKNPDE